GSDGASPSRCAVRPSSLVRIACCALLVLASLAPAQTTTSPASTKPVRPPTTPLADKKLIEFGWDEPNTAYMRKHIAAMEETPFDGCVFHCTYLDEQGKPQRFMNAGWGKRAFTDAELQPALDDLKATPFKRFTHNFHRFNVLPGDVDWFDDFASIVSNARLSARIAKEGNARGILFDIEPYAFNMWDYPKQRDAKTRSWEEYAAQARLRGREIMTAFQEGYPDLPVLLTFGYSWPLGLTARENKPLPEVEIGLLAPFLDGMLDATTGGATLIEGFERSYGYKDAKKFDDARTSMLGDDVLRIVGNTDAYAKHVRLAFGIWMDYDSGKNGWEEAEVSKNYFTPEQFETSVRKALSLSDEYVWIYTERCKWWDADGKREKLPEAYDAALRRAAAAAGR
ncbi:MAG: hypothetical protein WBD40_10600, partial [Tepidisphaeraceae bacterium]